MGKFVNTVLDFNNQGSIANLPNAVNPQDPMTLAQGQAMLNGLQWKPSVFAGTTSNINIASPGSTFDGLTATIGKRILLFGQTNPIENGVYIWNGATSAMTRSADMATSAELNNAVVEVDGGGTANGGTVWRQQTANPTVGTSNIVFGSFIPTSAAASTSTAGVIQIATQTQVNTGTATNLAVTPATLAGTSLFTKKYATTFGDGTSTSYAITHNLNTTDVEVSVFLATGTGDDVEVVVQRTSVNVVTIITSVAPASNAYRVVVVG